MPEKIINNTIIIAFSIGLLLLLVILFLIITTMLISLTVVVRRRQSRGNGLYCFLHCILAITIGAADVTDHVPVDDNPAYMTMKRITLNKNSAYETVNTAKSVVTTK